MRNRLPIHHARSPSPSAAANQIRRRNSSHRHIHADANPHRHFHPHANAHSHTNADSAANEIANCLADSADEIAADGATIANDCTTHRAADFAG